MRKRRRLLPPLDKQLAVQRNLLTALAGQLPQDQIAQKFDFAYFHLPRDLPVTLPSKLVEHRPDVKAAEANLHQASAAIGVAEANRLPVLNLSADLGSSPANWGRFFTPPTLFYTLIGSAAQSVFDGGTLLHKQRAAEAAYEQADAQYRSTVITAFPECRRLSARAASRCAYAQGRDRCRDGGAKEPRSDALSSFTSDRSTISPC